MSPLDGSTGVSATFSRPMDSHGRVRIEVESFLQAEGADDALAQTCRGGRLNGIVLDSRGCDLQQADQFIEALG